MPALKKWIAAQSAEVILDLASNSRTLPKVLEEIWQSLHFENEAVQLAIASNPSSPPDVLRNIRFMNNLEAVEAIASNPSTPDEILVDILQDKELIASNIEKLVVENPGVSRQTLRMAISEMYWENKEALNLARFICNNSQSIDGTWHYQDGWDYFTGKGTEILGHLYIASDWHTMFTYRHSSIVSPHTTQDDIRTRTKVMQMTIKAFKSFCKAHPDIKPYCGVETEDGRGGDRIRLYKKLGFTIRDDGTMAII